MQFIMAAQDAKVEELLSCLPGDRILDWYSDGSMWHERILIWKGQSPSGWYVFTRDLDLYEQNYDSPEDGPSEFRIKGRQVQFYSRLNRPVYKFSVEPSEQDMKGYIETALDEMGLPEVPLDGWRPSQIKVTRHVVATSVLLGRRSPGESPEEMGTCWFPRLLLQPKPQQGVQSLTPWFRLSRLALGRPGWPPRAWMMSFEARSWRSIPRRI